MTKTQKLAYLAGCIDCDGSISVCRNIRVKPDGAKRFSLIVRVSFTQVNPEAMDLFKQFFGGNVYYYSKPHRGCPGWHQWYVAANNAVTVISTLLPFLVVKRKQAIAARKLQALIAANKCGRPLTEKDYVRRIALADEVRSYNARRTHSTFSERHPEIASLTKCVLK